MFRRKPQSMEDRIADALKMLVQNLEHHECDRMQADFRVAGKTYKLDLKEVVQTVKKAKVSK